MFRMLVSDRRNRFYKSNVSIISNCRFFSFISPLASLYKSQYLLSDQISCLHTGLLISYSKFSRHRNLHQLSLMVVFIQVDTNNESCFTTNSKKSLWTRPAQTAIICDVQDSKHAARGVRYRQDTWNCVRSSPSQLPQCRTNYRRTQPRRYHAHKCPRFLFGVSCHKTRCVRSRTVSFTIEAIVETARGA